MTDRGRRDFMRLSALGALAAVGGVPRARAGDTATLPFGNGERPLVAYPGKRPLLQMTARPPQLETPFAFFD
jgi:sulfite dehydrogenase (cytochrome) subunit A